MDPFSALQVAAAITQFVELGIHVGVRIKKFMDNSVELPEILKDIEARVKSIEFSLKAIKESLESEPENYNLLRREAILNSVQRIEVRCNKLNEILAKYLPENDDHSIARLKAAFASISLDPEIRELTIRLNEDINPLILARVAVTNKGRTIPTINEHLRNRHLDTVPPRHVSTFIHRNELLNSITEKLEIKSDGVSKTVVLQGMGGLGKTQMALEYCKISRREKKYSGLFWVDAANKMTVMEGIDRIYQCIKPNHQPDGNSTSRVAFVKNILAEWEANWLIVFDNYDDPKEFNIQEYFPNSMNGKILVTSRSSAAPVSRLGPIIEVPAMSDTQALKLFYSESGINKSQETDEDVSLIVRRLGFHPLAINQAAVYLREKIDILPVSKFLGHYEAYMMKIFETGGDLIERPDGSVENKTVMTIWSMSYEELLQPNTPEGSLKADFLSILSCFDESEISEELFAVHFNRISDSPNIPEWLRMFITKDSKKWDNDKFGDIVTFLKRLSLVQSIWTGNDGFIYLSLHPLVRDWIKLRQSEADIPGVVQEAATILASSVQRDMLVLPQSAFYGLWIYTPDPEKKAYFMSHVFVWLNNWKLYYEKFTKIRLIATPNLMEIDLIFPEALLALTLPISSYQRETFLVLYQTEVLSRSLISEIKEMNLTALFLQNKILQVLDFAVLSPDAKTVLAKEYGDFWAQYRATPHMETIMLAAPEIIVDSSAPLEEFRKKVAFFKQMCDNYSDQAKFTTRYLVTVVTVATLFVLYPDEEMANEGRKMLDGFYEMSEEHPNGGEYFRQTRWTDAVWNIAIAKTSDKELKSKLLDEYERWLKPTGDRNILKTQHSTLKARMKYFDEKNPVEALEIMAESVEIIRKWSIQTEVSRRVLELYYRCSFDIKNYTDAIFALQQLAEFTDDIHEANKALQELAVVQLQTHDVDGAEATMFALERAAEYLRDTDGLATALLQGCIAKLGTGKRHKLLQAYEDACRLLSMYREHGDVLKEDGQLELDDSDMDKRISKRSGLDSLMFAISIAAMIREHRQQSVRNLETALSAVQRRRKDMSVADLSSFANNLGNYLVIMQAEAEGFDTNHWADIFKKILQDRFEGSEIEEEIALLNKTVKHFDALANNEPPPMEYKPEEEGKTWVKIQGIQVDDNSEPSDESKPALQSNPELRNSSSTAVYNNTESEALKLRLDTSTTQKEVESSYASPFSTNTPAFPKGQEMVEIKPTNPSSQNPKISRFSKLNVSELAGSSPDKSSRRKSRISQIFSKEKSDKPTLAHLLHSDQVAWAIATPSSVSLKPNREGFMERWNLALPK